MRFRFYSFIALITLYLLIFRNEEINQKLAANRNLHLVKTDTIPGRPLYINVYTGDSLDLWYDAATYTTLDRKSGAPIDFYINTVTWDTVYGRGRFVVNNLIKKNSDGKYVLDENKVKIDGDELKIKDGLRKLKIDGDEMKIKNSDGKMKYDEKDMEGKIKVDSTKIKSDDGEIKLKSGDSKLKSEEDKTKVKEPNKKDKVKSDKSKTKEKN